MAEPDSENYFAQNYFGAGEPAEHAFGVQYQAEWETPWDGTAVAARRHALALAETGMPVLLKSFSGIVVNEQGFPEPVFQVGIPESVRKEIGKLDQTSIQTLRVLIRHLVVSHAGSLERLLVPRHLIHADPVQLLMMRSALLDSTIAFTVWERDRVSREIARELSRVGENWVPCAQNAAALIRSGVPADKVQIVPHPYDPRSSICRLTERRPLPDRRFYAIGRWEPRKGLHELLEAFLLAFRPGDAVYLTLKASGGTWKGYPALASALPELQKRYDYWSLQALRDHVAIDDRRYPESRILKLHYDHNIYVLPSHGEAWGLPAFEAKLAGNRLVHVPYGGSADYGEAEDIAIPYRMEPVHPSYGWEPDAEWASVSVGSLADALRKAEPPRRYVRPSHYERMFGMEAVGQLMRSRILKRVAADRDAVAYFTKTGAKGNLKS